MKNKIDGIESKVNVLIQAGDNKVTEVNKNVQEDNWQQNIQRINYNNILKVDDRKINLLLIGGNVVRHCLHFMYIGLLKTTKIGKKDGESIGRLVNKVIVKVVFSYTVIAEDNVLNWIIVRIKNYWVVDYVGNGYQIV